MQFPVSRFKSPTTLFIMLFPDDSSTASLEFSELTPELLHGAPGDDPRYCWLSGRRASLAAPEGDALLMKFGVSGAETLHLAPADAAKFLSSGRWDGLCVEDPYQELALSVCRHLTHEARAAKRVNLLLREGDGTVSGDFTLGTGLSRLLPSLGVAVGNCRAVILTDPEPAPIAAGLANLLEYLGAPRVHLKPIAKPLAESEIAGLPEAHDATLLINASSFGRAPDLEAMPIRSPEVLKLFPKLAAVLDLVDDPIRTRLVWNALRLGLHARSTLGLRVIEAREATECFTGRTLPFPAARSILADIRRDASNIVLIGMPGCGKTTVGKVVAARLMREFVDIDTLVEHRVGKSSQRIYRENGEAFFREHETAVIESLAGRHGLVISTGGGACLKPRNRMLLALNGTFYWMQRPLSKLSTYNRPIPQTRGVEALYEERAPIYRDLAERVITVKSVEATASEIIGESAHARDAD